MISFEIEKIPKFEILKFFENYFLSVKFLSNRVKYKNQSNVNIIHISKK